MVEQNMRSSRFVCQCFKQNIHSLYLIVCLDIDGLPFRCSYSVRQTFVNDDIFLRDLYGNVLVGIATIEVESYFSSPELSGCFKTTFSRLNYFWNAVSQICIGILKVWIGDLQIESVIHLSESVGYKFETLVWIGHLILKLVAFHFFKQLVKYLKFPYMPNYLLKPCVSDYSEALFRKFKLFVSSFS